MTILVSLDWQPIEAQGNIALTTVWVPPVPWELDTSFEQGSGADWWIERVIKEATGYKLLGWYLRYLSWDWLYTYSANKTSTLMRLTKTYYAPDKDMKTGSNFDSNTTWLRKIIYWWWYLYVANTHTKYNWVSSKNLTKLNESDLSVALANSWTGFSYNSIEAYYANWKIFVAPTSWTMTYNWGSSSALQVINTDLTLDTTLTSFFVPNWIVTCVFEQADGKVVISWAFTNIWGTTQNRIVRYNTDWTLDTTFTPWTWPNTWAIDIRQLSDGTLVLWWAFTSYNWTSSQRIVRINTNWTVHTAVASWFNTGQINTLVVDWSDNIYCWWSAYTSFGWVARNRLCKLSSTLVLDWTFTCDCNGPVQTLLLHWNNLFVSWQMTTAKGTTVWGIVVVSDSTWDIVNKLYWWFSSSNDIIVMIQTTDFIYIHNSLFGNVFWWVNTYGAKLVADIISVSSKGKFLSSSNWAELWQVLQYATDWAGTEYYTWGFQSYSGIATRIAKFVNWVIDSSFLISSSAQPSVILYDNWGLIALWQFTTPTNRIVKYLSDGTVDSSFVVGTWFDNTVFDICKLSNGNYLIASRASTYNWVSCNHLISLDIYWTKDTNFVWWNFVSAIQPKRILELSNWNILVYWNFTTYKWVACNRAIMIDSVWNHINWLTENFNTTINKAVEYNGKIYFTWTFSTFGTTTVNRIACIDIATGQLDNIFGTWLTISSWTPAGKDLIIDEWKLVVVWDFDAYNWTPVWRIARIHI